MKLLVLPLVLLLGSAPADGQAVSHRFGLLGVPEGLSQSTVTSIVQDHEGFLWIGTESGLNRYDGYRFITYQHEPGDPHSLSNSFVHALLVTGDGTLWIGTYGGGLNRYDRAGDRFSRYAAASGPVPDRIVTLLEGRDGTLWIGSEAGLYGLDAATGQLAAYRHEAGQPNSLSSDNIRALAEDADGGIWIGAQGGGLDYLVPSSGRIRHHAVSPGMIFHSLLVDRAGTLWIGTEDGGLGRYDRETDKLVNYRHERGNPESLSSSAVRSVLEDRRGRLWVATGNGLNMLDRSSGGFTRFEHNPARAESIASNALRVLFEDRSGVLWVGSWDRGLIRRQDGHFALLRPVAENPNASIGGFAEDEKGNLWIGTYDEGAVYFDRAAGTFTRYRHRPGDPSSLSLNRSRPVYYDRWGEVWVGTSGGGVNRLLPDRSRFAHYRQAASGRRGGIGSDFIISPYEDRRGDLWFNTFNAGPCRFDRSADRFTCMPDLLPEGVQLSSLNAYALYHDPAGRYWVSTWGIGIDVVDLEAGSVRTYQHDPGDAIGIAYNSITCFHEDRQGQLWIGTYGGGLNRYEPENDRFIRYTTRDGLADNVVYGVLEDDHGRLWISTTGGISRFDPASGTFRNFDARDGLQGDEFNGGSFRRLRSGEMVFGGSGGFNLFHPDSIRVSSFKPPVALTSFRVLERERRLSGDEEIRLGHRENFISFEFTALDFTQPEKIRYAYMLDGLDDDWVFSETRRFASYPGLRPGRYTLRVKATNSDGVWNEAGLSIPIHVVPPFWMTGWFRALVLVLLLGSVAGGARYVSVQKLRRQLRALETERRLQGERERISRDLHDHVGASLSKIAILSELAGRHPDPAVAAGHVSKISATSREVIDEISEIIWAMNPRNDTLDSLAAYLRAHLAEYFEPTDVTCRFEIPDQLPALHVSSEMRRNLLLVAKEAAHNIVRHAGARNVDVRFGLTGAGLELSIEDDGRGFDSPGRRFGNGLINMRKRIEEVGGAFEVLSTPGGGTTVRASVQL